MKKTRRWISSLARACGITIAFAICVVASGSHSAIEIGVADIIVGDVYGRDLSNRMSAGESLIYNQKVRTGKNSGATLQFKDYSRMTMGERAEMLLDDMVYDPEVKKLNGLVQLKRGVLRFSSLKTAKVDLRVRTPVATVGIRGTTFDVLASPRNTEISVLTGKVRVSSQFGSQEVGPGQTYNINFRSGANFKPEQSAELAAAVGKMLSMISEEQTIASDRSRALRQEQPEQAKDKNPTHIEQQTKKLALKIIGDQPEAFYHAISGKILENLIYIDLKYGRVVIELLPNLAPLHVARIKELARAGFYNGLTFHRVQKGFAAETGDPTGTGRGGSGKILKAEISQETFVRGVVGMKHDINDINSADSQFFIISGSAKHLDNKYSIWGRVIYGMEFVDLLKQGAPPKEPDTIQKMAVASDVN